MANVSDRIPLKCVFVSNYTEHSKDRCTAFDVAFLTEANRYVEYQPVPRGQAVTPEVQGQYMSLMSEYQLTARTRIFFCGVGEKEPIRLIFRAFAQPLGIKIRNVTPDAIVRRICHLHENFINKYDKKLGRYRKDKEPKKYYLQQVWRKLIKQELCPWITAAYDQHIRKRGYREYRYRKQLVRLGMYYMLEVARKRSYDLVARGKKNRRTAELLAKETAPVPPVPLAPPAPPEQEFRTGLFS